MSINRTQLSWEGHYTMVPNTWARDKRLTRKARGLLTELLSHRVGWKVTTKTLVSSGKEGREAVVSAIKELVELGYLRPVQERDSGKFAGVSYELSAPHVEPVIDPEDDDEPSDTTVNGFHRDGETRSEEGWFTGTGKSDPKKNIRREDDKNNQSVKSSTTEPPVDNSGHDDGFSIDQLSWSARRRYRRASSALDMPDLINWLGPILEADNGIDPTATDRVVTAIAYQVLGKAAHAGTKVAYPNAYIIGAVNREIEVWRRVAFNLEAATA